MRFDLLCFDTLIFAHLRTMYVYDDLNSFSVRMFKFWAEAECS